MSVEFNEIPDWVCWIAQDKDGTWWGYQVGSDDFHVERLEAPTGTIMNCVFEVDEFREAQRHRTAVRRCDCPRARPIGFRVRAQRYAGRDG